MASVSGTSRALVDIIPQYPKSKLEIGSVRLKSLAGLADLPDSTSRFPKLEECAHFHYDLVDLPQILLSVKDDEKKDSDGIKICVTSGTDVWEIERTYTHFVKLDKQLHQCVFDRKFSELPNLEEITPKTLDEKNVILDKYTKRLSDIGSCGISCGPVLSWLELDNRGRRIVGSGNGINTPAVAAAFATTPYTANATDELSFQTGDMISVIDMPPAEESLWWRGKRGYFVGFFPSNCVAVITDKIPSDIALAEPSKPVLRKHGKLIAFFRAFILSRPSRRRLKQSGILKERVFGCDLSEHLLNSGYEIPLVLKCCAEFIEAHGIVDGIYRLSGVTSNIQRLRSIFDEDRIPVLSEDFGIKQDIHGVASLLKMYFRELPNPLCTYQLYDEFVSAVQSPHEKRLENMKKVVQKLPPPHYRTLEYLMGHLGRVCNHSTNTGMTARNVAIVWAPNLLRCRSLDQGVAALQGVGVQAVVTEFLILYSPMIFNNQLSGDSLQMRPKSLAVCSPTKLLSLQEAQARGQHSPTQQCKGESSETLKNGQNYHTIIDLPRKRQPLNWRAIFTPRRNYQVKSPRRFKRKPIMKSAEFICSASGTPQISGPPTSNHSRSVSHDSYFDTAIDAQHSTSSLIETQHEGLSLSLDLSELHMNFDIEESEMRIFSEDETNQLFSSGASIAFDEHNLEQRFSTQELRYIDSYSPDGMDNETPSDPITPGYQLLTPNSYDNLKTNDSSKKSDASPYGYEKLAESPNIPDMLIEKKENDLYESGDIVSNTYETMELETYEPVTIKNHDYENDKCDSNIYEDVQVQYSPSEIYEQVSNFRNSIDEVNKLVEEESPKKNSSLNVTDNIYENTKMENSSDIGICQGVGELKSVQINAVPERGDGDYESIENKLKYNNISFKLEEKNKIKEPNDLICDNNFSELSINKRQSEENKNTKMRCSIVSEVLKKDKNLTLPLVKENEIENKNDIVIDKKNESELERRERIEKYKEERRNFFRNKYKIDTLNNNEERDDELIRRFKQKTKRDTENVELKSPTRTTVNISYSPTKAITDLPENSSDKSQTDKNNSYQSEGSK